MFKLFRVPLVCTAIVLLVTLFMGGLAALVTVVILGLLEITFSFDNAIVNAKILSRMNAKWQHLFLTVGIVIAVLGMRLILPLEVVSISAHINPFAALQLAIGHPKEYATHIRLAHPSIAAFGGVFLLMLFMDWLLEEREVHWITVVENRLTTLSKVANLPVIVALGVIVTASVSFGHTTQVLISGCLGLVTYLLVASIDTFFDEETVSKTAKAGLATFLYLEVLDASFSFDGVIGAFAVTNEIFLIAAGLGIGAMFIRGLTVYLTNKGTLGEYRYLEHGAHWAIGTLAVLLLLTIKFDISDMITGLIGLVFIGVAFIHSIKENKKEE